MSGCRGVYVEETCVKNNAKTALPGCPLLKKYLLSLLLIILDNKDKWFDAYFNGDFKVDLTKQTWWMILNAI